MIAELAIAAALSTPVIGFPISQDGNGQGKPLSSATVLNPQTLKPKPGAPKLPSRYAYDVSPDGSQIAATSKTGLTIYDVDGRAPVAEVAFGERPAGEIVAWLSPERLLVLQCIGIPTDDADEPFFCREATVRVIDPQAGTLVRTETIASGVTEVSRAGDHVIAMLGSSETLEATQALVIDSEGATRHTVDVAGALNGPLVAIGAEPGDGAAKRIARIDVETGEVTERELQGFRGNWVLPSPNGTAFLAGEDRYMGIDPVTLETVRKPFKQVDEMIGAGKGYVLISNDAEGIRSVTAKGRLRWKARLEAFVVGAIGRYVYVQEGLDKGCNARDYRVSVFSLKTGKRVRVVRGRYDLQAPQGGNDDFAVPGAARQHLLCDD